MAAPLVRYEAACRALAEAKAVDEVKEILDAAVAMRAYAKQAKNRDLEADAVEIRMRATRRLDQLRQAQKELVGLASGGEHGGRAPIDGSRANPSIVRPTLLMQGIDKNLAHQGRVLGAQSDEQFERTVTQAREAVSRALRTVVQVAEIDQERERAAQMRTETGRAAGGTIDDLIALAASGFRAGAILIDPPWPFATWSHTGLAGDKSQENRRPRSRAAPYRTMSHEDIYKLPIESLAAADCALFLCVVQTQLPQAFEALRHWGFDLKSVAFGWFKGEPGDDPDDIHVPMGCGYWTRAGFEQVWLATRGKPRRLHADVRQVIVEPRREHSRKPDCIFERIERLAAGPYLELFARRERPGWTTWGDELAPPPLARAAE